MRPGAVAEDAHPAASLVRRDGGAFSGPPEAIRSARRRVGGTRRPRPAFGLRSGGISPQSSDSVLGRGYERRPDYEARCTEVTT